MEKKIKTPVAKRYSLSEERKLQKEPTLGYNTALAKLQGYLEAKHKKHTAEREYILNILYRVDTLVDPPTLHKLVCEQFTIVSPASVYNSLLLFQELGIVRKIMLMGDSQTFFERTIGNPPHAIAVCQTCGVIWSLPHLGMSEKMEELLPSRFYPQSYSIVIGGICQKCHKEKKKAEAAEELAYQKALEDKAKKRAKAKAKAKTKRNNKKQ